MSNFSKPRFSYCDLSQPFHVQLKRQFNHWKCGLLLLSTLSLVACDGGNETIATPPVTTDLIIEPIIEPVNATKTGVFVDSRVEGLQYKTATKSGITNSLGEYDYIPGESVTFFIGGIVLGSTLANGVVTPLSLVSEAIDETNLQVTNIVRFLMTLDGDSDPDNGITINPTVIEKAVNLVVDFKADLSTEPGVTNLLNTMSVLLVDESTAQAHFSKTLVALGSSDWGSLAWGISTWGSAPETAIDPFNDR
jgi:hypothetical protein